MAAFIACTIKGIPVIHVQKLCLAPRHGLLEMPCSAESEADLRTEWADGMPIIGAPGLVQGSGCVCQRGIEAHRLTEDPALGDIIVEDRPPDMLLVWIPCWRCSRGNTVTWLTLLPKSQMHTDPCRVLRYASLKRTWCAASQSYATSSAALPDSIYASGSPTNPTRPIKKESR